MRCIFIRIKKTFEGHSSATIKKVFLENDENTPYPKGAAKISHCYVKLLDKIDDIACKACLILQKF